MLINGRHVRFIAEVKPYSPAEGERSESWEALLELACEHGDMISIHTNPLWKGSFERLYEARKSTTLPILAKGFHFTDQEVERALGIGADAVLVVGRIPDERFVEHCYIEPLTRHGFDLVPANTPMCVWNARNLVAMLQSIDATEIVSSLLAATNESEGHVKKMVEGSRPSFDFIAKNITNWPLCQASHLRTVDDVHPNASAILVGSHLKEFVASLNLAR